MKPEIYSEVALAQNISEYNLKIGNIATLVDFISHPQGGEEGCILEIFNAVSASIDVVIVPLSAISSLEKEPNINYSSL
jgi:hypothetical protein